MTPKPRNLADYYIKSGNATQAAIRAGYSEKSAKEIGAQNLTKLNIKKYVVRRYFILDLEIIGNEIALESGGME